MKLFIVGSDGVEHSTLVKELEDSKNSTVTGSEANHQATLSISGSRDGKKLLTKAVNAKTLHSEGGQSKEKYWHPGNRSKNLRFYSLIVQPEAATIQTKKRTVDNGEYRIGDNKYIIHGSKFTKLELEEKITNLFKLFNADGPVVGAADEFTSPEKHEILKAIRVYTYITSFYGINADETIYFEYI